MSMAIWRCQREWEIVIIGMQHTGWAYDMGQRARERRTCTMAAIRGVRECGLYGLSRFTHCGHASQRTRRERATRGPGWRSRRVGTSTDHADRCTARSSLQLTTPRSLSECVLKLRASCGLALSRSGETKGRDLLSRGPPRANTTSDKLSPTSRKQVADRVAEGHRGLDATSAAA